MIKLALAQLDFTVGDIVGNAEMIIHAIKDAKKQHTDLIVFPELALTGYPLEDLLHRSFLYKQAENALKLILPETKGIDVLLGYPEYHEGGCFNAAAWMRDGKFITKYHKQKLPNYSVFDEARYFKAGSELSIVEMKGVRFTILICEDIWHKEVAMAAKDAGADCLLSLNASPFSMHKSDLRLKVLRKRTKETGLPIVFVNLVGGQDELVFDGYSLVLNADGTTAAAAAGFKEELLFVEMDESKQFVPQTLPKETTKLSEIYNALTLGIKDYVTKNHFPGVIIGLSGGIDSALTLALAVDALGADKVTAVYMPSEYSSDLSTEEAKNQAQMLNVQFHILPIQSIYKDFMTQLQTIFVNNKKDTTEENLQARIRGTILMALSNKTGNMVLSTGNKSEMAVGYSTLYGDMVGGFNALKDIFKLIVYDLANYRNKISPVIPERVIDRPPSAELAPDQCDQDTLPPYEILDEILELFIEQDKDVSEIIQLGHDEETTKKAVQMVLRNEYKRRQSPPGVRITEKAFGRDRRYPITSGYKPWMENDEH